ncbi:hypothetical protein Poly24_02330 [Rosistilla carotiformis]|uniref:Uncharacterized protein n=1 Tax=Rosistilla carotiformis TaxID=2528017 RepID=A0A518JLX1_9BACT|nr:hypothetical protein [Rosistilla carotiformis]QDV66546.1 hypothetical protein Poly24_02330 [Rosistilla carotiformis]
MSTTIQATTLRTVQQEDLRKLASVSSSPCVSILMPTHRTGREVQQAAIRLKNLLREATEQLQAAGDDCSILAPTESLSTSADFWQHQADGLAIYLCSDQCFAFKVNRHLEESVTVGDSFVIAPLISPRHAVDACFLLALTWDEARLFRSDGESLESVETKLLPAKFHDLVLPRDPEESLQHTSHRRVGNTAGTSTTMFHGQGEGEEKIEADRRNYLSRVSEEVAGAIYNSGMPLVLMATTEVGGHFAATSDLCIACHVEGSPARSNETQLLAQLRSTLGDESASNAGPFFERFGTALSRSQASSDLAEVRTAAKNGRVESVMISREPAIGEALNSIVIETLRHGGEVASCPEQQMPQGVEVAAILRF